jgi:hypothetical protein
MLVIYLSRLFNFNNDGSVSYTIRSHVCVLSLYQILHENSSASVQNTTHIVA